VEERTYELFAANQELHQSVRKLEAEIAVRKQVEKSLGETEERYRAVIGQSPEAVLLCDPDTGEILDANPQFTERFGYDQQLQGAMNLFDLNRSETDTIRFMLDLVKSSGFLPARRYAVKHRNGTFVDVDLAATLVRYQGRLVVMLTFCDVTEIVRREQQSLSDAQLATRVQTALLSMPGASDFVAVDTIYQPFGYVGGDLYFLDWRYGGLLLRGFLIDVAGHGLATSLHTASLHVLLREVNERDVPLSEAMRWINRRVGDYFDEATFAGALGFELDLETRQLRWSCAGLPEVWMATRTLTGVVAKPGLFLGILTDETFETHEIPIAIGDSFYFMTDGLTDLLDRQKDLALERYSETVDQLRGMADAPHRRDDATAICIHVTALPQSSVRQDGWPKTLRFNGYGDYQRLKGEVAKILAEVTGQPHSIQEVAVHEALANAMECRDGVPRQNQALIRFNKIGDRLIIRVKTSRMGFAGNAILRRLRSHPEEMFAFGEDASMGRGIPIMLSLTDQMVYNSEGTEVLLAWKL
jgi:PAS domain S-box-containing protein